MLLNLQVKILLCLDDWLILASSEVEALGTRDVVFYFFVPNWVFSIAPFSLLSVTVFDLHRADFMSQTWVTFTSPERFHSSVADSSFSILVATRSHCLEDLLVPVSLQVTLPPVDSSFLWGYFLPFWPQLSVLSPPSRYVVLVWRSDSSCSSSCLAIYTQPFCLVNCIWLGWGSILVFQFALFFIERRSVDCPSISFSLSLLWLFMKGRSVGQCVFQHWLGPFPQTTRGGGGGGRRSMAPHCRSSSPSALAWILGHFSQFRCYWEWVMWWLVPWAVDFGSKFRVDLGSGVGRLVTTRWSVLVISLPPLSFIICLLSLLLDPLAVGGRGCFLQSWDGFQAYTVPTFSPMQQVLTGLGSCKELLPCLPLLVLIFWASQWLLLLPFCTGLICSGSPLHSSSPEPPLVLSSCLETLQRFVCSCGSSRRLCQRRWGCSGDWCYSRGHSVSSLSVSKIAGFCPFLVRRTSSLSALKGLCSFFPSVFEYELPVLWVGSVLWDLLHSFEVTRFLRSLVLPLRC